MYACQFVRPTATMADGERRPSCRLSCPPSTDSWPLRIAEVFFNENPPYPGQLFRKLKFNLRFMSIRSGWMRGWRKSFYQTCGSNKYRQNISNFISISDLSHNKSCRYLYSQRRGPIDRKINVERIF